MITATELLQRYRDGERNFDDADLQGADLSGADLSWISLYGADLSGCNLSRAKLRSAYLSSANLKGADLSYADLSSADLFDADLEGANLKGAETAHAWIDDEYLPHECECCEDREVLMVVLRILLLSWGRLDQCNLVAPCLEIESLPS
ncbi:MAG: pentapeptide repeat-containing protein [Leptolyngbya sp. BL-A-14]